MVCTTGFLLGIGSTIVIGGLAALILSKWIMNKKTSSFMDNVIADATEKFNNLNVNKEETNGIKENSEEAKSRTTD